MDDAVDQIQSQWARIRPDLDVSPMGVVGRVSRASRLLERGVKEFFAAHGLESWEFDVLVTLLRSNEKHLLCMGDLTQAAMISSAALTNRVDRLVAKGLVQRAHAPDNRRTVLITLTEAGARLAGELVDGHYANERRLLEGLDGEEQEQLRGLLRKLLLSLGDTGR